jgi:hypothetical protein
MNVRIGLVYIVLFATTTLCAEDPTTVPKASLQDVSWIAGRWQGTGLGGEVEETWNPPKGDSMMGMFKFMKGGKTQFYELLTIVPREDSLVLRLRHFDSGFRGWEEKDEFEEFPLTKIASRHAQFGGLTFQSESPEDLTITVLTDEAEAAKPLVFRFTRKQL